MNKIVLGALVCAAVAGAVAWALYPERVNEVLGDLRKKGEELLDELGKASAPQNNETDNAMG